MLEKPGKPFFGSEAVKPVPGRPPKIKAWRSITKAISWRALGSLDTLVLSFLIITYLGPVFGLENSEHQAAEAATYIAITEVATRLVLYFLHERLWARIPWGRSVPGGKCRETNLRSATKTGTFRTLASLDTVVLGWIFTGNFATALSIGGTEIFTKMALYFAHERVWARLRFGIERH